MKEIFCIFLLLLGLTLSDSRDTNYKKGSCAGRAATIANDKCKTECLTPSDSCQECILSKMPQKCKSLPTSDCYKCSKLHSEIFPVCKKELDIPNCMGGKIKEPSCAYCICTLSCKLYGPNSRFCKLCRDENDDMDYSEYWLHSHALANPKCDEGWILSNDFDRERCFKAFSHKKKFYEQHYNCGQLGTESSIPFGEFNYGTESLAITDTDKKRNALIDAANDGNRKQYWIDAICISGQCDWYQRKNNWYQMSNPISLNSAPINRRCFDIDRIPSALVVNKNGKWCNLSSNFPFDSPADAERGAICEQGTCSVCLDGTTCCPNDGECIGQYCVSTRK